MFNEYAGDLNKLTERKVMDMKHTNSELVERIKSAVGASPDLQKQLAGAQSKEQVTSLLSAALGGDVSAADIDALNHAASANMTDEQLEAVAGGVNGAAVFISIITAGAFCALSSVVYAVKEKETGGCENAFK